MCQTQNLNYIARVNFAAHTTCRTCTVFYQAKTGGCHIPKQCCIAMVCNSKLQTLILWSVISVKLNIGKKITGIEIMTLNHKKI